jgi:hypothetical protein
MRHFLLLALASAAGSSHLILVTSLLGLLAVACFALLLSRPGALLKRKIDPNVLVPTAVWGQRGTENGVK